MNSLHSEIYNIFKEKNCELTYFVKKSEKLKYICACNIEKEKLFKDFIRRGCRTCREKKFKEKPAECDFIDEKNGEIWRPIIGGWISNFGNAKNALGKLLTLCPDKYRYHINGLNQYASRLVAVAFEIENFDKLSDPSFVISHIDGNPANNNVKNLIVNSKSDVNSKNGMKSRQSDNLNKKVRNVLQYTLDGEFIKEYHSIAEASRQTGEHEHAIREVSQGKRNSKAKYKWSFKNDEESKEFSLKYKSK